jgi:hypothetical protein
MRRQWWAFLLAVLLPLMAGAQEIRGSINGIVQDSNGSFPALVKITNTGTSQTAARDEQQRLLRGRPLNSGHYAVRVELQGRDLTQSGISLAVGQP